MNVLFRVGARPRQLKRYTASLDKLVRHVTQIRLFAALPLLCVVSLLAQTDSSKPKVTVHHTNDHGVAITTIKLDPILIQHDEVTKSYTLLSASVAYEDKSPKPKVVSLSFHARSPGCRFSNKSNLLFAIDNDTITITKTGDKSGEGGLWIFSEPEGNLCNESCAVFISEQTFQRITKSKRVEARLGDLTLLLDELALKALRHFAAHIPNA